MNLTMLLNRIFKRISCFFRTRYAFKLHPVNQLEQMDKKGIQWISKGMDPRFLLKPLGEKYPQGIMLLRFFMKLKGNNYSPRLYMDLGKGISEETAVKIPISKKGTVNFIVNFPQNIKALRLDPMDGPGKIYFDDNVITFTKISKIEKTWRMAQRLVPLFLNRNSFEKLYYDVSYSRSYRPSQQHTSYEQWIVNFDALTHADREAIKQHIETMSYKPLISVIMPVYNTPETFLRKAIDSVIKQLYPNWELCIADDASTEPHVQKILMEYSEKDNRIKVVTRKTNGHISAASNSALEIAKGEFAALLDHDDELADKALYRVAAEINICPDADLIYSDEDKIDEQGERFSPHFKPDWNPELFFSNNYICHLSIIRTELIRKSGYFRKGFEGSQDYDLLLRCIALTDPLKIRHIPEILYHWRAIHGSTALKASEKSYTTQAGLKALRDFFSKSNPDILIESGKLSNTYRVRYPVPDPEPRVSLIIPTRNGMQILSRCIESILTKTQYSNYEIIVVDNQSDDPDTISYLKKIGDNSKIRIVKYDYPFNFSAINNYAVKHAQGEIIGLINNDIEVISPEWLKEMVSYAMQPGVGAVGAKLLYPDGRVQHAGVIVGLGGVAGHSHKYISKEDAGYYGRAILPQALSAVTAACLVIRKKVYEEIGGIDEENLTVAFNDVDFCLRLQEAGYRNVWTPYALLYHHESVSRGYENTQDKQRRFLNEIRFMKDRWGKKLLNDLHYNPNLTLDREDFSTASVSRVLRPWCNQDNG